MFRKTLCFILALFLSFSILAQSINGMETVTKQDGGKTEVSVVTAGVVENPVPSSPVSVKNPIALTRIPLVKKVAPAELKGATYKLKNGVQQLPASAKKLFKVKNGAFVLNKGYSNFRPSVGQIYIDNETQTAMQVRSISKDSSGQPSYRMANPSIDDVIADFNIPAQTVRPNVSNVKTVPGVTVKPVKKQAPFLLKPTASLSNNPSGIDFASIFAANESEDEGGQNFAFKDITILDKSDGKNSIKVTASGSVNLESPAIELSGKFDDYVSVDFTAGETVDIKITGDVVLDEDVTIPLGAYEVPFGFGKVYVGIYLNFKVNGNLHVEIGVNQNCTIDMGASADLWWFIPHNIKPHNNSTSGLKVTTSLDGRIHAEAWVIPKAGIEFLGMTIGELSLKLGLVADAAISNTNVDIVVNAVFNIKVVFFDEDYTLFNKEWELYQSHKRYTGGYTFNIEKADSYYDQLQGTVQKDKKNYTGDIVVNVRHTDKPDSNFDVQCQDGKFSKQIPLAYTDKVKLKAESFESDTVDPTFPFDHIEIKMADAYNNDVKGIVFGDYSGPVVVSYGTSGNLKTCNTQCNKGVFQANIPDLLATDTVMASMVYEGFRQDSKNMPASVPIKINVFVNDMGTWATIDNLEGPQSYNGQVKINCLKVNCLAGRVLSDTEIAEVFTRTKQPASSQTSSTTTPASKTPGSITALAYKTMPISTAMPGFKAPGIKKLPPVIVPPIVVQPPLKGNVNVTDDKNVNFDIGIVGKTTYVYFAGLKRPPVEKLNASVIQVSFMFEGVKVHGSYIVPSEIDASAFPQPDPFTAVKNPIMERIDPIVNVQSILQRYIDAPNVNVQLNTRNR